MEPRSRRFLFEVAQVDGAVPRRQDVGTGGAASINKDGRREPGGRDTKASRET